MRVPIARSRHMEDVCDCSSATSLGVMTTLQFMGDGVQRIGPLLIHGAHLGDGHSHPPETKVLKFVP